jgi:Holliday junction resolvase RusA-like endonuclease
MLDVYIALDEDGAAVIVTPLSPEHESSLRGDIDNYVKTILDGLNEVAWEDDRQVLKLTVVKT